jgi:type VI secretion system protein ImpL
MALSFENLGIGIGVVFAGLVSWFGAIWLHLQGANVWVFRIAAFLFMLLVIGAIVLWQRRRTSRKSSSEGASAPGVITENTALTDDVLSGIREAEAKIASSTRVPRGTRLSSLPVIFFVGESGSGKSSTVLHSGLEPELLTGQVSQDGKVIPTRLANLWFARKIILLEIGGKLSGDARLWTRLLGRLTPSRLRSILGKPPSAPRIAVVCVDSEKFVKASTPDEVIGSARGIRARLEQISSELGISLPVYVIFTRTDRIPFFEDYFRSLSSEDTTQVLGATLPVLGTASTGVYQEQESKRLSNVLNSIFQSLSDCRPGMLFREQSSERLPGIYEFPREIQKRIPLVTQFLVDLCRPSQLSSSPFLRGFYFTGVRLVEAAPLMGATVIQANTGFDAQKTKFSGDATSIMRSDEAPQAPAWQGHTLQMGASAPAQKTSQWLFLSHIFSHVILEDRTALGVSGSSSKSALPRKILYAALATIAVVGLAGMLVSFFANRELQARVLHAGEGIASIQSTRSSGATVDELKKLDNAKQVLEELSSYQRDRVPLYLRWGLYSGEPLYKDFRSLYFDRFKKLLFGDVQGQMASFLRTRPANPVTPSDDDYSSTYNTLKAYLMTTTRPEKSDTAFLSQFLLSKWQGPSNSPEQNGLAQEQFTFYADEIRIDDPYPVKDDRFVDQAVDQARHYLHGFTGANLVYRGYLNKLRQTGKFKALKFLEKYPDATGIVREPQVIDGAFTKDGWKFMQGLISRNDWNTDDEWVLDHGSTDSFAGQVDSSDVRKTYQADYIRVWRDYVKSASMVGLEGPADASRKLDELRGNRSPLFQLLCEVSENTDGTSDEIAKAFEPVRDVVKAPCYNLVSQDSTKAYRDALSDFKLCIDRYQDDAAAPSTQREDAYKSCKTQNLPVVLKEANNAVKTVDHEADLDKCVVDLLKLGACPLSKAPAPLPPSDVFCSTLNRLALKYPFRADAIEEATIAEFESFFRPGTGILSEEIAKGGGQSGSRANLLKLGESIQRSLYPAGSSTLQYRFSVTAKAPQGLQSALLDLDGTDLRSDENAPQTQSFVWPGKKSEAELRVGEVNYYGPFAGTWAVFRLFGYYNWSAGRGTYHLESPPLKSPQGVAFRDSLELTTEGVPLFRRGYLSQFHCPAIPSKH